MGEFAAAAFPLATGGQHGEGQGICCRLRGTWGTQGSAGFGSRLTCVSTEPPILPFPPHPIQVLDGMLRDGSKQDTADRGCCLSSKLEEDLKKGLVWR